MCASDSVKLSGISMCKEILQNYDESLNSKELLHFVMSGNCKQTVIMKFMFDILVNHINNQNDVMHLIRMNNRVIVDLINRYLEKCEDVNILEFVMSELLKSQNSFLKR